MAPALVGDKIRQALQLFGPIIASITPSTGPSPHLEFRPSEADNKHNTTNDTISALKAALVVIQEEQRIARSWEQVLMIAHSFLRTIETLTRTNTPSQEEGSQISPVLKISPFLENAVFEWLPRNPFPFFVHVSDRTVPVKEQEAEPTLLQRIKHEGSVLSLAMSDDYIFAGTQRNHILVQITNR